MSDDTQWFKIVNVGDAKTCDDCREWIGKIVSVDKNDLGYPTVDDFIKSNGLHPNCRCSLQKLDVTEIPRKAPNPRASDAEKARHPKAYNSKISQKELKNMALNAEPLKDKIVYRGFVDETLDEDIGYNFDDTLVMITPLGEFYGSSPKGEETKEIIDEESVKSMATQTEEILLDRDHASMRTVDDRDTEAMGWISNLQAITDLGNMSGLYGVIKWAGKGRSLVEERAYRYLSPVFELDENGRAIKLVNVALTNRPALKMPPILNGEANDIDKNLSITKIEKDSDKMNKEEIETLVKDIVTKTLNELPKEEKKEEVMNTCDEEKVEVKEVEEVKNETPTTEEEVKVEEKVEEEVKPEVKEEKVEEKKEEVIKAEVLNSMPQTMTNSETWRNLHGQAFFDYINKHPEIKG